MVVDVPCVFLVGKKTMENTTENTDYFHLLLSIKNLDFDH